MLTVCDIATPGVEPENCEQECDILVFPHMIRYLRVTQKQIGILLDQQFIDTTSAAQTQAQTKPQPHDQTPSASPIRLESDENKVRSESTGLRCVKLEKKWYILVCAHKLRDKRCGVCGPILHAQFDKNNKRAQFREGN